VDQAEDDMPTAEARVVLTNKMGLHARPSTQIATAASRFISDIRIAKEDVLADAKSVLELLMLAAECGSELVITAEGEDASQATKALVTLIEGRFGELDVDH
jgi:phosphotransferase system HPr (HPr) family protein